MRLKVASGSSSGEQVPEFYLHETLNCKTATLESEWSGGWQAAISPWSLNSHIQEIWLCILKSLFVLPLGLPSLN